MTILSKFKTQQLEKKKRPGRLLEIDQLTGTSNGDAKNRCGRETTAGTGERKQTHLAKIRRNWPKKFTAQNPYPSSVLLQTCPCRYAEAPRWWKEPPGWGKTAIKELTGGGGAARTTSTCTCIKRAAAWLHPPPVTPCLLPRASHRWVKRTSFRHRRPCCGPANHRLADRPACLSDLLCAS